MTKRNMKKFYNELRQLLGEFDLELIGGPRDYLEECGFEAFDDVEGREIGGGFRIRFTPFEAHKPFYRGQK